MTTDFILSFDPGGSEQSWAYCLSRRQRLGARRRFVVEEAGFVPTLEDIAAPDLAQQDQWLASLIARHRLDAPTRKSVLVAERYVGRGHTGWMNEYIPFQLGYYAARWAYGPTRFIMAAQWKVPLKKLKAPPKDSKYDAWWGEYFEPYLPHELQGRGICHVQDACAIGLWTWAYPLEARIEVAGIL